MERAMIEKNTIKSQDSLIDCNNGKRSSETLIETISKLETTIEELERTKKQLAIAVKRIEFLKKKTAFPYYGNNAYLKTIYQMCDKALRQIKELDK